MDTKGKSHRVLTITMIFIGSAVVLAVLGANLFVMGNRIFRISASLWPSGNTSKQTLAPRPSPETSTAIAESDAPESTGPMVPAPIPSTPAPVHTAPAPVPKASAPAPVPKASAPAPVPKASAPAVIGTPAASPGISLPKWPAEGTVPILYNPGAADGSSQTSPLAGLTVILDPGHGGSDVGAEWTKSSPTVYEAPINLAVSLLLRDRLAALGARVEMTRTTDSFQSLHYRAAMTAHLVLSRHRLLEGADVSALDRLAALFQPSLDLNTDAYSGNGRSIFKGLGANADLRTILDIEKQHGDIVFVSLHCNSLPGSPSVNGLQVLWSGGVSVYSEENKAAKKPHANTEAPINPSYQFYDDAGRIRFAQMIWTAMTDTFPDILSTGSVPHVVAGNFAVLREINLVSAVVEMGFLSNAGDRADLLSDSGRDLIAAGVAEGVRRWYLR